ncbi:GNAT family N-acetyltransferase [Hanstruepera neustonica]|uniref:GNAT family N-acetyltransferase n=1 Tax=Hanstruepera neustonica TaxID=1445657 RepID=A0A2K1DW52_9FLAO|nr:GNAT family N-acetyltransferase [Hanstruepera neustonica]PNQ72268.1 GNAT family N-acetyltransferase [Hanstruepera neustonica]
MIKTVTSKSAIKITAQLAHSIWNQHYVPIIGQDQVDYMIEKFQSETAITQQIQEGYQYFMIEHQSRPCGYLALVPNPVEGKIMISKIYVDSHYRGLGLGLALLDFTVKKAQNEGFKTIWLTVNKYNTHSIQWYEKQGFQIKEKVEFDIGNGFIMDDYLLEKPV